MKQLICALGIVIITASAVFSADHHGMTGDQAIPKGIVQGYTFEYHMMDMRENMKKMAAGNPGMNMSKTHHLMVSIKGPAKVQGDITYTVKGPDGKKETVKTMAMGDGYGADISMPVKGSYTIETRVSAKPPVVHSFVYNLAQ